MLNFTTYLLDRQGRRYCASATWNHMERLDDVRFVGLYQSLLQRLRSSP